MTLEHLQVKRNNIFFARPDECGFTSFPQELFEALQAFWLSGRNIASPRGSASTPMHTLHPVPQPLSQGIGQAADEVLLAGLIDWNIPDHTHTLRTRGASLSQNNWHA